MHDRKDLLKLIVLFGSHLLISMLLPQSVSLSTEYGARICSCMLEVVRAINIGQHMWNLTLLIKIIYYNLYFKVVAAHIRMNLPLT